MPIVYHLSHNNFCSTARLTYMLSASVKKGQGAGRAKEQEHMIHKPVEIVVQNKHIVLDLRHNNS